MPAKTFVFTIKTVQDCATTLAAVANSNTDTERHDFLRTINVPAEPRSQTARCDSGLSTDCRGFAPPEELGLLNAVPEQWV